MLCLMVGGTETTREGVMGTRNRRKKIDIVRKE